MSPGDLRRLAVILTSVKKNQLKLVKHLQTVGNGRTNQYHPNYYRILQLHLGGGIRRPPKECPGYDIKQSNEEASVLRELWRMQSIPLLPSLPNPLWPGVVAPYTILSMGQIDQNCILMLN